MAVWKSPYVIICSRMMLRCIMWRTPLSAACSACCVGRRSSRRCRGAFFHPFHSGPADLHSPDFYTRRQPLFERCLQQLEQPSYGQLIKGRYQEKLGLQSPFVFWGVLDEVLLDLALQCIPAAHLHACFTRLLRDLKANRVGMPDLIQFYPQEQRYRMIEVKGPGDRLQDNQKRWLAFAAEQGIPVEVCYVSWDVA